MKLYEIKDEYLSALENLEIDEATGEVINLQNLAAIQDEFEVKADNIACYIKDLTAQAEAIKAEKRSLEQRQRAAEKKAESLKNYLRIVMAEMGMKKLQTGRNAISTRKTTALHITDEKALFDYCKANGKYLRYKEPEIAKKDITDALKAGQEITGAELETRDSLIIK